MIFQGDEMQILFILSSVVFFVCLYVTMSAIKETTTIRKDVESSDSPSESGIISLLSLFVNLLEMPTELKRLIICQTLGWLAFFSTQLFFTDFIAQVIILKI